MSPNGDHLAILSAVDGERDIFVVTPAGQVVTRIRRSGRDFSPAWIRR